MTEATPKRLSFVEAPEPRLFVKPDVLVDGYIKPIETAYAGCRFRSRLEARWAVFFDHLGIEWDYEPEGFEMSTGAKYLPDFYLPDLSLWVEVKAVMSHRDLIKVCRAALELPVPDPRSLAPRLIVLGNTPRPVGAHLHSTLSVMDDYIIWGRSVFSGSKNAVKPVGSPIHWFPFWFEDGLEESTTAAYRDEMVVSVQDPDVRAARDVTEAYRAARSARFEHGESGYVTDRLEGQRLVSLQPASTPRGLASTDKRGLGPVSLGEPTRALTLAEHDEMMLSRPDPLPVPKPRARRTRKMASPRELRD